MAGRVPAHVRGNLVAYLALFVALGGTASAAIIAKNSVNSRSIVNGQVKKADLGKAAVIAPKLGPDAVTGAKVAGDSLTGADLDEASLGAVPSAGTAASADLLRGNPPSAFAAATSVLASGRVAMAANETPRTLISNGTLTLTGECPGYSGGDRPQVILKTAPGTSAIYEATGTNPATSSGEISAAAPVTIESFVTGANGGRFNVVASDGRTLSGGYILRGGGPGAGCILSASGISG